MVSENKKIIASIRFIITLVGFLFLLSGFSAQAADCGKSQAPFFSSTWLNPLAALAGKLVKDFGYQVAFATPPDPDYNSCGTDALTCDVNGASGVTIDWSANPAPAPYDEYYTVFVDGGAAGGGWLTKQIITSPTLTFANPPPANVMTVLVTADPSSPATAPATVSVRVQTFGAPAGATLRYRVDCRYNGSSLTPEINITDTRTDITFPNACSYNNSQRPTIRAVVHDISNLDNRVDNVIITIGTPLSLSVSASQYWSGVGINTLNNVILTVTSYGLTPGAWRKFEIGCSGSGMDAFVDTTADSYTFNSNPCNYTGAGIKTARARVTNLADAADNVLDDTISINVNGRISVHASASTYTSPTLPLSGVVFSANAYGIEVNGSNIITYELDCDWDGVNFTTNSQATTTQNNVTFPDTCSYDRNEKKAFKARVKATRGAYVDQDNILIGVKNISAQLSTNPLAGYVPLKAYPAFTVYGLTPGTNIDYYIDCVYNGTLGWNIGPITSAENPFTFTGWCERSVSSNPGNLQNMYGRARLIGHGTGSGAVNTDANDVFYVNVLPRFLPGVTYNWYVEGYPTYVDALDMLNSSYSAGYYDQPSGSFYNNCPITLSVSRQGTGASAGTVKGTPWGIGLPFGINCGSTCSYAYSPTPVATDISINLDATVIAPSTFDGWSGCDNTSGSLPNQRCHVTMYSARTVTANFTTPCAPTDGGQPYYQLQPSSTINFLMEHGICRNVINTGPNKYLIPTGSTTASNAEWCSFLTHLPTNVATSDCCPPTPIGSCP